MIFDLMSEGAIAGSFSDTFIGRTGSVKLLGMLFRSVAAQSFQSRRSGERYTWQVIVGPGGDEVGFLKFSEFLGSSRSLHLEFLAIRPEDRNKGFGTAVLEDLKSKLPEGGQLIVHCTKYARVMQHILKTHRLKRNVKFGVPQLEEYSSAIGEL